MRVSVVIPVYNSCSTLEILNERLLSTFKDMKIMDFEIILIDDGSKDGSYTKMLEIHDRSSHITIIRLLKNYGQQNAIMCGLRYATGEFIVTLDDDLQNPPEEIRKLLEKISEGYDVVFGVPLEKKHPLFRNLGTKAISGLFNKICNKPKEVEVSSFRLMKKGVVEKIIKDRRSFVYLAPIILCTTQNISTVLVRHDIRKEGKSNYSMLKLLLLLGKLIIYYSFLKDLNGLSLKPQYSIKDLKLRGDK